MLRTPFRTSLRVGAVTALAFAGLAVGTSAPAVTTTVTETVTLGCTGAPVEWTVPAGVTAIEVEISGAAGGRGDAGVAPNAVALAAPGGLGGTTTGTITTTPGETLVFTVGCAGGDSDGTNGGAGGFGGSTGGIGGDAGETDGGAGGGGGGSTDVRQGGTGLAHRVLVAGGGGGSGGRGANACAASGVVGQCDAEGPGGPVVAICSLALVDGHGGDGGGEEGAPGGAQPCSENVGGGGGTQSAGGAGGVADTCFGPTVDGDGAAGTAGSGGAGGTETSAAGGGGGGGGWFGGGGGGGCIDGGGGGGGSGHGGTTVTALSVRAEANEGDGQIVITYTVVTPDAVSPVVADPTFTG